MSASFYLFVYFVSPFGFILGRVSVCIVSLVDALVCGPVVIPKRTHINFYYRNQNRTWFWLISSLFFCLISFYLSQNLWAKVILGFYCRCIFGSFLYRSFRLIANTLLAFEQMCCLWSNFLEMRNNKLYYLLRVTNIIKINCFFIWCWRAEVAHRQ